jgi:hypothetical protein
MYPDRNFENFWEFSENVKLFSRRRGKRGGKDGKKVGGLGLKYTSFITKSCQ